MNDTRTTTALALWLLFLAPQWALLLGGMNRLTELRQAVARSFSLKLLAVGLWVGSTLLAMFGTVWVWRDLSAQSGSACSVSSTTARSWTRASSSPWRSCCCGAEGEEEKPVRALTPTSRRLAAPRRPTT